MASQPALLECCWRGSFEGFRAALVGPRVGGFAERVPRPLSPDSWAGSPQGVESTVYRHSIFSSFGGFFPGCTSRTSSLLRSYAV